MEKFTLEIGLNNEAFQDGNLENEIERLLKTASKKLQSGHEDGKLIDVNGNAVGSFEMY